jgi:hypothetical protein
MTGAQASRLPVHKLVRCLLPFGNTASGTLALQSVIFVQSPENVLRITFVLFRVISWLLLLFLSFCAKRYAPAHAGAAGFF